MLFIKHRFTNLLVGFLLIIFAMATQAQNGDIPRTADGNPILAAYGRPLVVHIMILSHILPILDQCLSWVL